MLRYFRPFTADGDMTLRGCCSPSEHVSGVENGAEQVENGVSENGADSGLNRLLKVRSITTNIKDNRSLLTFH